ncbi:hypothetical protein MUK42_15794 [Musa troglodytarum]|uniref:Uncharacterized protein n=1 Tax=Musa troglodytarum TaxID=320322 RepID=A0A9E7HP57_9LILI|nr:hypothetical protein MUK42_15794 [Musa troglodytarum]
MTSLGMNAGIGVLNLGAVAVEMLPYEVGLGIGGGSVEINSISPSAIGSYQSQAALRGLGAYHNSYLCPSTGRSSRSGGGRSFGLVRVYCEPGRSIKTSRLKLYLTSEVSEGGSN